MASSFSKTIGVLVALFFATACSAVERRPVAPSWEELVFTQQNGGFAVQSRIDFERLDLTLPGPNLELLRPDPPLLQINGAKFMLDHARLVDAFGKRPASEALAAYHDYVDADLEKRGFREVKSEKANVSLGRGRSALYWLMQAQAGPKEKPTTLTACLMATTSGAGLVAMTGVAGDKQAAAMLKSYFAAGLTTLDAGATAAMSSGDIERIKQDAERSASQHADSVGVILLNDDLASQQDRQGMESGENQHYVLSSADMANAAAAAASGRRDGLFITSVNDGRSQHTFLIHGYDAATDSFEYSDSTGNHSLLEAGNNVAGVEAVRKPGPDRLWVVKKDQLQTVLSSMIVGNADVFNITKVVHLGPFGGLGGTPAEAKETDFFKWFNLEETANSDEPGGGATISYSPTAQKFHPLVAVRLNVARQGWIRGADLILKRRFIEEGDPSDQAAARDIAKSFLSTATTKADWKDIHDLHDEIFYLGPAKMLVSESDAKQISIPWFPSDGYLAFAGRRAYFQQMLTRSRLWMENIVYDSEPALLISFQEGR